MTAGKALSSRVGKWFRVGYLHGNWGSLAMEEDATGECAKGVSDTRAPVSACKCV